MQCYAGRWGFFNAIHSPKEESVGEICTKFSSSKGEVLLLLDAGRRKINKKDKARRPTNSTQNNRMFFSRTTERKERGRKCENSEVFLQNGRNRFFLFS